MNFDEILREEKNKKSCTQDLLIIVLQKLFTLSNNNGFRCRFVYTETYFTITVYYESEDDDFCLLAYEIELYDDSDFTQKTLSKIIDDLDSYIERSKKYE